MNSSSQEDEGCSCVMVFCIVCSRRGELRPVVGVVCAGLVNLNDDEDVLEVGADGLRGEGQSARLLEHDRHDVVADVPFP